MTNIRAKKRLLGVCRLQTQLAQSDLAHAEGQAKKLEMSRAQILEMTEEMFGAGDCRGAAILVNRLDFGHRLITLNSLQNERLAEAQDTATALRSSAHMSTLREEHAEREFKRARKFHDQKLLEKQSHQAVKYRFAWDGSKKGLS